MIVEIAIIEKIINADTEAPKEGSTIFYGLSISIYG
jgi:hypothetical protein